jgi:hypothetical protein
MSTKPAFSLVLARGREGVGVLHVYDAEGKLESTQTGTPKSLRDFAKTRYPDARIKEQG